jgi:dihydroorotase
MKVLFKKAKVIDKNSPFHLQIVDVLVENGIIVEIGEINQKVDTLIEFPDQILSAGFIDLRVNYKDPGHEAYESLETLTKTAASGGFTEIVGMPNTKPCIQSKESISYFKNFSIESVVTLFNAAAITKNCEGKDFTEMMDLKNAGAVAFTDGSHPIWNSDILLKTLQYLYPLDALLINKPEDQSLSIFGQMHEGLQSTLLGMKGIPSAAEELMIIRDLKLLEYSGLKSENSLLHFSLISTEEGVELIRKAKKEGLPISCDIAAHQLAFIDEDLKDFDTNLKVSPPFRSKKDQEAIIKGLQDGTIDAIVSDHNPFDEESKNLEFDLAECGIIGLQTAFLVALNYSKLAIEEIVEKFTNTPRNLVRLKNPKIAVGEKANLSIFSTEGESVLTLENNHSNSKNSPFFNTKMKGRIYGVINNKQVFLNH